MFGNGLIKMRFSSDYLARNPINKTLWIYIALMPDPVATFNFFNKVPELGDI